MWGVGPGAPPHPYPVQSPRSKVHHDRRLGPWALDSRLAAQEACIHYARLPWRLHGVPSPRARPAPSFGSHTRRILGAAGLNRAAIRRLIGSGIAVARERTP
jgi:hypothetical protein